MSAAAVGVSLAFGLGVLFVFDGLTRDRSKKRTLPALRIAPSIAAAFGGGLAGLLATGWGAAAIGGAVLGWMAPKALTRRKSLRMQIAQREALAEVAAGLRDAVRAGLGLNQGLSLVAQSAPGVLREEVKDLAAQARMDGLGPAAQRFAARIEDPFSDFFARALALADREGATGITDVLDGLADSATQMAHTTREIRARQVRHRMSARFVAGIPIVLLVMVRFSNPEYLSPYSTAGGQAILLFGFGLIAAGYWAMAAAARLPEPSRSSR